MDRETEQRKANVKEMKNNEHEGIKLTNKTERYQRMSRQTFPGLKKWFKTDSLKIRVI